jgi:hypothetical protein
LGFEDGVVFRLRDAVLPDERVLADLCSTLRISLPPIGANTLGVLALPSGDVLDRPLAVLRVPSPGALGVAGLAVTAQTVARALRGVVLGRGLQITALGATVSSRNGTGEV